MKTPKDEWKVVTTAYKLSVFEIFCISIYYDPRYPYIYQKFNSL